MTLMFSTFILFTAEACFAWLMVVGITACLWWFVRKMRNRLFNAGDRDDVFFVDVPVFPRATDVTLVRFMWFQVAFLVVWSVCFKAALYTSLLPWYSRDLMAKGQSLGIAIPAEVLALLLALGGLVVWIRSRTATGNRPKGGAREQVDIYARIDDLVEWYRTFGSVGLGEVDRRRGVE
jgi:hypothetical protein